jgi:hypothetical protein
MNKMSKIDKTKAYSWRPSAKLKRELEAVAKHENASFDTILERAVREWLAKRTPIESGGIDEAEQRAALMECAGIFTGDGSSATNERVREVLGEYLEAKYGRRHSR